MIMPLPPTPPLPSDTSPPAEGGGFATNLIIELADAAAGSPVVMLRYFILDLGLMIGGPPRGSLDVPIRSFLGVRCCGILFLSWA